ncbi:MAG: PTS transporter subunit EIIC, partial [Erysipelotrichaceae bacterium]|nr:PTS transporter subunit EIIC [Erysipelotrichaceae bacterium]
GAGMIKVLCVLLSFAGILDAGSTTYTLLNDVIADGVYYFLPFFVAHNAAKKMGVNPLTAMALAAIILHPKFLALAGAEMPVTLFGLPVQVIDYSTQAIPMILGVLLLKYVDKFAEKVSPSIVSIFLRTMIDFLIVAPIMLLVLGPISMGLSNALFAACTAMMSWGWLAVGINALIFPLMVLTGTHNATIPLIIQMFTTQGFDPIFLVSGLAVNIAEAGAACAVALKTKNVELKSTAFSATLSAMLGITEPALYGVNLRLKRPFIAMMIGSFIGGCFCGLIGLAAPTFATPSILTCAIFVPAGKNFLLGFLGVLVSFAAAFVVTWIMGFEDIKG